MRLVAKLPVSGYQTAVHAFAVAAFIILAFTDHRGVGYAVTLIGLIGVALRGNGSGPATITPALTLLAAGVLCDLGGGLAAVCTGVVLLALITSQAALAKVGRVPRVRAFNLPGFGASQRPAAPGEAIATVTIALVALLAAAGYASWPLWPMAIASLVGLVAVVAVIGYGRVQLARMKPDSARLGARLDQLAPAFIAYFAGDPGEEHQLVEWLPYLEQIGSPFLVVTRDLGAAQTLSRATQASVLHCPTVPTVDAAIRPSVRAVFYVNTANLNSHIARFSKLAHIQLLHGDSDKPASYNPVTSIYDHLFVAGPAAIARYADHGVLISDAKFEVVGRPQVAGVEPAGRSLQSTTPQASTRPAAPVVLYAPTSSGRYADEDFCSLPRASERMVRALIDAGATVILRGHPELTGSARRSATPAGAALARAERLLRADRARTGRPHVFGVRAAAMSVVEAMNASDAMISDVSAMAVDYLASGKPLAIVDVRGDAAARAAISPLTAAAYRIAADGSDCGEAIAAMTPGGDAVDEKQAARHAIKSHYLATDRFIETARRLLDAAAPVTGSEPIEPTKAAPPAARTGSTTAASVDVAAEAATSAHA